MPTKENRTAKKDETPRKKEFSNKFLQLNSNISLMTRIGIFLSTPSDILEKVKKFALRK